MSIPTLKGNASFVALLIHKRLHEITPSSREQMYHTHQTLMLALPCDH